MSAGQSGKTPINAPFSPMSTTGGYSKLMSFEPKRETGRFVGDGTVFLSANGVFDNQERIWKPVFWKNGQEKIVYQRSIFIHD